VKLKVNCLGGIELHGKIHHASTILDLDENDPQVNDYIESKKLVPIKPEPIIVEQTTEPTEEIFILKPIPLPKKKLTNETYIKYRESRIINSRLYYFINRFEIRKKNREKYHRLKNKST